MGNTLTVKLVHFEILVFFQANQVQGVLVNSEELNGN